MKSLSRRQAQWILVVALLVGAALRLYGLYDVSPPGLARDEVANWLIDQRILAGEHAVYFTQAYGHEAGFHYVQAAFVALLGDHSLALRLPTAFLGLLLIAASYTLARRLFGTRIALTAAVLLAVLFYPVFFSRIAFRAMLLPVLAALSAYFWWRGWGETRRDWRLGIGDWGAGGAGVDAQPAVYSLRYFVLAGVFAGLSLHSYMAARAVPIFYLLFVAYLALFHRDALRARWRGVLLFWLVGLLVAAPLVIFLLTNPGAEYRISEVNEPMRALLSGNLRPAVDNFVDILGAFGFAGDPLWRQHVAHKPLFDPLLAAFFYLCLPLCAVYVRDERYAFLILWLFSASIPSIVTIEAPSSIRIINILPVLTLLPAIVMHNLGHLSTEKLQLSTDVVDKWIIPLLLVGLFVFNAGRTIRATFVTWPANDEVQFVFQEALMDVGHFLDRSPDVSAVAIGGWTPDSTDPFTMALSTRREPPALRYFNPQETLLIPGDAGAGSRLLTHPKILPLHPLLQAQFEAVSAEVHDGGTFLYYVLPDQVALAPDFPLQVTFGDEVVFLGHSVPEECGVPDADSCQLLTFWQALNPANGRRRFYLHLFDGGETPALTGDALGASAPHWRAGDLIVQRHTLAVGSLEPYEMRVGVYDPESGQRLLRPNGLDYVTIAGVAVE